ncbi:MAG: 50S ribosomal protein L21e [Thermoplasmata archaeon]|nr:50S ribosomal protein L21e [Thermoplasmata archaeon]
MVKRSKGFRVRTRRILRKSPRQRGMPPITTFLKTFEVGEKAAIVLEPSSQKGMPHPRYHGMIGEVVGRRGNAYLVKVRVGRTKFKILIARPEHLKKVKNS